jgi:hypothetical protein
MLSGQVAVAEPVSRWQLQDAVEAWENIRCVSKVKGVAFSPMLLPSKGDSGSGSGSGGEERMFRVLVSLANNSLELYDLSTAATAATAAAAAAAENSDDKKRASQYVVIDSGGHRLGFLRVFVSTMHQDLSILLYVCMYVCMYVKYSYTISILTQVYTTTYIYTYIFFLTYLDYLGRTFGVYVLATTRRLYALAAARASR